MQFDRIDHAILREITRDGRKPIAELAGAVGLSASACSRRLHILEREGAIRGYHADVNPAAFGLEVTVYVQITLDGQGREELTAFEEAVRGISSVLDCHLMAGEADYILRLVARDITDYEHIHRDQLSTLPHVSRMTTSFSMREVVSRPGPLLAGG